MENRYKLPLGVQKKYLSDVEMDIRFSPKKLSEIFGISERSYRSWKNECVPISVRAVSTIEKISLIPFPYSKDEALAAWRTSVSERAKKGGFARLEKYGDLGTREGRAKGGKIALEILRKKGLIPALKPFCKPSKYTKELAEFVGIMLGDGHLASGQWSITLNSIADSAYCDFVMRFVKELFGFSPGCYKRKDCNANVLYGGGIEQTKYLEEIGLKVGHKVRLQIAVPAWILRDPEYRISCLRGLLDTDGGVFIHRYLVAGKKYEYKKLSFANCSVPLINFVYESLSMLQLQPRLRMQESTKRVWIYGEKKTLEYLDKVGSHNQRLLRHGGVG